MTDRGDLVVPAVQRRGEDLGPGDTELAPGDTLLVQGTWDALATNLDDPDVLVVTGPRPCGARPSRSAREPGVCR